MTRNQPSITRRRLLAGTAAVGGVAAVGAATAGPSPTFEAVAPDPGSWPMPRFGPRNTATNPHATPPRDDPQVAWEVSVPGAKALAVADETVFVGSDGVGDGSDQGVAAFDAATGERRWHSPAGAASLCVRDGTVYCVTGPTAVVSALDAATGERRCRHETGTKAGHFVLPGENALYVGLHGWVDARDLDSGALRWRWKTGGLGRVGVGIAHGRLYVGGPGPTAALEPREGPDALLESAPAVAWRARPPSDFRFAPAVTGDAVLVGGRNPLDPTQTVTAHDSATGDVEWTGPPLGDKASTPAVAGSRGYVGAGTWRGHESTGAVVALDLRDGEVAWRRGLEHAVTPPVVADGTVFAGTYADDGGPVVALDATTGETLWTRASEAPVLSVAATEETLYVGTEGGSLSALREQ